MKKELKTDLEKIAYNCRKATYLIEKKQCEILTGREKLELKIHLAGCYICRVYEQQSILISSMVRNLMNAEHPAVIGLDDNYKKILKQKINHKLNNNR